MGREGREGRGEKKPIGEKRGREGWERKYRGEERKKGRERKGHDEEGEKGREE